MKEMVTNHFSGVSGHSLALLAGGGDELWLKSVIHAARASKIWMLKETNIMVA